MSEVMRFSKTTNAWLVATGIFLLTGAFCAAYSSAERMGEDISLLYFVMVVIGLGGFLTYVGVKRAITLTHDDDEAMEQTVTTSDDEVTEQMERARKFKAAGEYRDAISVLSKLLDDHPKCAPAYYQRGYCYSCVSDWKSADKDFRRGFEIDPLHVNEVGTVSRRCMMAARALVSPEAEARPETIAELVDLKFRPEVRTGVLRVLKSIEKHPPYAVGVEQLQRVVIKLSKEDGRFITEEHFWKSDPRDLVMVEHSRSLKNYDAPGFIDLYRARLSG